MKNYTIAFLALMSLLLTSCGSATTVPTDAAGDDDTAYINLASEEAEYFPLRASFMSDNRTMAYTFDYDGNLLKMLDTQFDGASEYGASFKVEGGAEITSSTFLKEEFVAPVDRVENECSLHFESVDHEEEVLVLRSKVCSDDDAGLAEEAMQNLLDGLTMEWL